MASILTGLTLGIITPARIGEYAGRVISLPAELSVSALSSHFLGSIIQSFLIIIFGYLSWIIFYFIEQENPEFPVLLFIFSVFFILAFSYLFVKKRRVIWQRINNIGLSEGLQKRVSQLSVILLYNARELRVITLLSAIRIAIFYTQYWLMMKIFSVDVGAIAFVIIALIYLIQTLIPLPAFLNWFVRGELALFFWGYLKVDEVAVLAITYSLWSINVVLPAFIGLVIFGKLDFTKWFKNGKAT